MIPRPVVVDFVRALGAVQAGVVAYGLVLPPAWDVPPLVTALVTGVAVFWMGRRLASFGSLKDVVAKGYIAPVATAAAVRVILVSPDTWAAAGAEFRAVLTSAFEGTPGTVYLACVAYACLSARPAGDPSFYR